jgi:hypothetical protein
MICGVKKGRRSTKTARPERVAMKYCVMVIGHDGEMYPSSHETSLKEAVASRTLLSTALGVAGIDIDVLGVVVTTCEDVALVIDTNGVRVTPPDFGKHGGGKG